MWTRPRAILRSPHIGTCGILGIAGLVPTNAPTTPLAPTTQLLSVALSRLFSHLSTEPPDV